MKLIFIILIMFIINSCVKTEETENTTTSIKIYSATIDKEKIIKISYIDSLLSKQIYNLRINAINNVASNLILNKYAKEKNISLKELTDKEIDKKIKKITKKDIIFIVKNNANTTEDDAIQYLTYQRKVDRQKQLVDSLKRVYNFKIKLTPFYFNIINTDSLFAFNITNNNSQDIVYIISDFECYACKKAKPNIEKMIKKYNKNVGFRFIYFGEYLNPTILNAIFNENNKNNFSEILNVLFDNQIIINSKNKLDSVLLSNNFSSKLSLIKSKEVLSKAINTKDFLKNNNIFSTPSFIVNNKVIDGQYALDYIEDIIIKEYKINDK